MGYFRNNLLPLLGFVTILIMIPVTVDLGQRISHYFAEAQTVPANIVIDTSITQGVLPRPWEGVSQGGELEKDLRTIVSVTPVTNKIKQMNIRYIRLDHLLNRSWGERGKEIEAIVNAGMTPVIALSYFPTNVAKTDVSWPYNWAAWETAVTDLVQRVSGTTPNVYYEVWNEPDGQSFGNMDPGRYFELYRRTVSAAQKARGVLPYKIGGPSLADPDKKNWLARFIQYVADENIRLDFISWHRYHRDPNVFNRDLNMIDDLLSLYPNLVNIDRLVTEWGTDPGTNWVHAASFDVAHLAAVTRIFLDRVTLATKFEIRDNPVTDGNKGLGILNYYGEEKPIFQVYKMLSKMTGDRVILGGEGTNVTGFAAREISPATFAGNKPVDKVTVMLSNFDKASFHTEAVPLEVRGMSSGIWQVRKTILDGYNPSGRVEEQTLAFPNGTFSFQQPMLPNSVLFLELTFIPPLASQNQ